MHRGLLIPVGIGLVVIAIAVGGVLFMQRGAHIELTGTILKVRMAPLDENSSIAVADFRFTNPSDYPFLVRTVTVLMEDTSGMLYRGETVSETDAKRLFEGYPLLGQKYNNSLIMRDNIPPHASWDRMVAARFELPEATPQPQKPPLEARKRFIVRIEEIDGAISELYEK
jgi:hypothetical protein